MKLRVCLLALAVMVMTSTVQAQSSSIAFSSDRSTTDLDIWSMDDDGTNQTQLTSEGGDTERPSISFNGEKIVYDDHTDILMINEDGTGFKNLTTPTSSFPGLAMCHAANSGCEDADAGPKDTSQFPLTGDFHIVFTHESESFGERVANLYMGTVDVSAGQLVDVIQLTNDDDPFDNDLIDYQATWCGDSHIVWSREVFNQCEAQDTCAVDEDYFWELCVLEVDLDQGPVGEPDCYFSEDQDGTANHYPSCNTAGTMVAFAQSGGDNKDPQDPNVYIETPHDVCMIDITLATPQLIEQSLVCLEITPEVDDTKPVWSPGDSQIAFSSERLAGDLTTDYDIWVVNSTNWPFQTPVNRTDTNGNIPDTDPDWGPAVLP